MCWRQISWKATGSNELWSNCVWKPTVCDDVHDIVSGNVQKAKQFTNYKANYNNDLAYPTWFQGYPARTRNASEADLFLVPYPHKSHCLCHKDFRKHNPACTLSLDDIQENIVSKLTHYPARKERHVFLFGVDWGQVPKQIRNYLDRSISISLGDASACRGKMKKLCGHFVTPYLSTGAAYQPDALSRKSDDWWTSRKRAFSVGAVLGTPHNFHMRVELTKNRSIHLGDSVGGLPVDLIDLGQRRQQILPRDIMAVYSKSIFCPQYFLETDVRRNASLMWFWTIASQWSPYFINPTILMAILPFGDGKTTVRFVEPIPLREGRSLGTKLLESIISPWWLPLTVSVALRAWKVPWNKSWATRPSSRDSRQAWRITPSWPPSVWTATCTVRSMPLQQYWYNCGTMFPNLMKQIMSLRATGMIRPSSYECVWITFSWLYCVN